MISLTTLLAICQQTEYDLSATATWWQRHHQDDLTLSPQNWTLKLRVLEKIARVFFFLPALTRIQLGLLCIAPFEYLARAIIVWHATQKLRRLQKNGLIVVAISGSYGKTSTKHILTHVLKQFEETVMTPESYNTPLGISQVIRTQLTSSTKIFVVELGEHYQGDIRKLCGWIHPDFGVVTPFGRQHLERMGSEDAIARTVGELAEYLHFNSEKCLVHEGFAKIWEGKKLLLYGETEHSQFHISAAKITLAGTEFSVSVPSSSEPIKAFSPLFGTHQALNILPAIWFALQRGHQLPDIIKCLANIPYISRRHEPTFLENDIIVLDNSYNTNPEAAKESLHLLQQLPTEHRFIVTMGFVELGEQSDAIHEEFGRELARVCEAIGLINSPRAEAIKRGYLAGGGGADHVVIAADQLQATQALQPFFKPHSVVLLEGGFQEMYA